MSIEFKAIEFTTAAEAIQHVDASGRGEAVLVHGRNMVVDKATLDMLEAARVYFATLHWVTRADGQRVIVTVPVNG